MRKHPKLKHLLLGIGIIIISLVRFHSGHFLLAWEDFFSVFTYGALTFVALGFVEKRKRTKQSNHKWASTCLALLFAIFTAVGKNYYYSYNWSDCFGGFKVLSLLFLQISLYTLVYSQIIVWLLSQVETFKFDEDFRRLNLRKWFWYILCVKLLFFGLFFPCLFDFDAALGVRTFLDPNSAICDHHPVCVEAIHALFFSVGKYLGNPTIGMALLSIGFILYSTIIVVYGIQIIGKTNISFTGQVFFSAVLAFFPFYPVLSLLPTKDGLFAYSLLLYIFSLFEIFHTKGDCQSNKKHLIVYSIAALSVCLTRHQGITIILLNSLALCLYYRKVWKQTLTMVSPSLVIAIIVTKVLFPYLNIEPGGKQEMIGTLFQQTAYYLKLYPKDITPEESEAINTILNIETMASRYKIHVTDPVKNEYKYNPRYIESNAGPRKFRHVNHSEENRELKNYLSAWATMGVRHPSAYAQATGAIALGFFFNSQKALLDIYSEGFYHPMANTEEYHFWKVDYFYQAYYKCRKTITNIPILNWITTIPYYIWATILLLMILCYRRDIQGIIIFLPVFLSIGILLICPVVNGRYIFPVVITLPLLLIYCLLNNSTNKKQSK